MKIYRKILIVFLLFILLLLPTFSLDKIFAEDLPRCKVITNSANIYESSDTSSSVVATAKHKDVFYMASTEATVGTNGDVFYSLFIEGIPSAFILKHQTTTNLEKTIAVLIVPNCKVKKDVSSIEFFEKIDTTFNVFHTLTIEPTTTIRIVGDYDENATYSLCQTLVGDEFITGYVKNELIVPNGLKRSSKILILISVIVAVGLTAFLSVYLKKRKLTKK